MVEESSIRVFTKLYNEYNARFVAIAASYLHNRSLASDVVADVFMDLWRRWDQITVPTEDLPRYLMRAVKNKCIDANRSSIAANSCLSGIHTKAIAEADYRILHNESIDSAVFSNEIRDIFNSTMETLPPRAKEVFTRSRMGAQTYDEIANEMGISVRKVTSDIQKALAALREKLKEYTIK